MKDLLLNALRYLLLTISVIILTIVTITSFFYFLFESGVDWVNVKLGKNE